MLKANGVQRIQARSWLTFVRGAQVYHCSIMLLHLSLPSIMIDNLPNYSQIESVANYCSDATTGLPNR